MEKKFPASEIAHNQILKQFSANCCKKGNENTRSIYTDSTLGKSPIQVFTLVVLKGCQCNYGNSPWLFTLLVHKNARTN